MVSATISKKRFLRYVSKMQTSATFQLVSAFIYEFIRKNGLLYYADVIVPLDSLKGWTDK